ncbi:MAG: hypothetical protein H6712_12410 [Myxococcales bacterium]|nr:hypothetical protein [Myxococcales bacterium]MCB9714659.1 hypothetical protein [Myxococcales bacterium]
MAVPIGRDGEWVGAEGRNSPLPKGRDTAVRVYVDVDESVWVQRDIEARLHLVLPDGTEEVLSQVTTVAGDSSTTSMQSGFLFGVLAEWMVPGVRYQVELLEAGEGYEGLPEPAVAPITPAEPGYIGVEDTDLQMKVVVVPVDYTGPGCSTMVDTSEETLQRYEDAMYQQNPLTSIDIQWGPPYVVNDLDLSNPDDFFTLLNRAVQLRASYSPDPNVYYYVLFDNCGACIGDGGGCVLGVAPGIPDESMGAATYRAAIGTQFLGNDEVGIETFVHEIGHTQGRQHVACPGAAAAGPDVTYPYDGGTTGVWGFGVRDFQFRNPSTHTDYMSYCNPTWVSDWQWNATYDRIRALTSWDAASVGMPDGDAVLVGMINPETGEASWWTEPGFIADAVERPAGHELRFLAGDEVIDVESVQVEAWTEGPGITVRAPLPAGYDAEVTAIEYREPARSYLAPRESVASYHRPDSLTTAP